MRHSSHRLPILKVLTKNRHLYPILHKWQLQQILFQQFPDENSECLFTPYIVILVLHGLVFHVTG